METLELELDEARQAAAAVQEADKLRTLAAKLPALERERESRARLDLARPQAAAAMNEATERLTAAQVKMSDWSQRFGLAYAGLEALVAELRQITDEIDAAAPLAKRAAALNNLISGETGNAYFNELPVNNFAVTWSEVGGTHPALDPLAGAGSDANRRQRFLDLIGWVAPQLFVYLPFTKPSKRYERI